MSPRAISRAPGCRGRVRRSPVAAVRAALWAATDRQAALLLTVTVQRGLCRAEDLALGALDVRRHHRRRLVLDVCEDLVDGVRALGELDFARLCREHRLRVAPTEFMAQVRTALVRGGWRPDVMRPGSPDDRLV